MGEWQDLLQAIPQRRGACGRFAPSPTGAMHLGNARTALLAWLSIRSVGGLFVWRMEDLDMQRSRSELALACVRDLSWLGLDWDEDDQLGGPAIPYTQSLRSSCYASAINQLARLGCLFPCQHSRRDLQELASAPRPGQSAGAYPASLRPQNLPADWYHGTDYPNSNLRLQVQDQTTTFADELLGVQRQNVAQQVGDFVLRRRDGIYSYQLAVVVDDILMGISEVLRGRDLLESTARQIELYRLLKGSEPRWIHVPLLLNSAGEKLSKRDAALELAVIREAGITPQLVCGWLAWSCGLLDRVRPCSPADLFTFSVDRLVRNDCRVPDDLVDVLRAGTF